MREGKTEFIEKGLHLFLKEARLKDETYSDCIARLVGYGREQKD